jgi:hypothetical protein
MGYNATNPLESLASIAKSSVNVQEKILISPITANLPFNYWVRAKELNKCKKE